VGDAASANELARLGKELFSADLFEQAETIFLDLIRQAPDMATGHLGLARILATDGRRTAAAAAWRKLIQRFPDLVDAKWLFEAGRAELAIGNLADAELLFAQLRHAHRHSALGWQGSLRVAEVCKDDLGIAYWTSELTRRGLAQTTADIAIATLRKIEAESGPAAALAKLEQAAPDIGSVKLALEEMRLRRRAIRDTKDMQALTKRARALAAIWPERRALLADAAMSLAVARDPSAVAFVRSAQHRLSDHPRGLATLAWAAAEEDDLPQARQHYETLLASSYLPALQAPCRDLTRSRAAPVISDAALCLLSVVRDELLLLPAFFRHYRAIGVARFVIVDNGSTDGSLEWLADQPDVELWQCPQGFRAAHGGMRWINHLMDVVDAQWALYVDADEFIVLPSEISDLPAFTALLDAQGCDAAAGFMLDMHPRRWADLQGFASGDDPGVACPLFTDDYCMVGDVASPWFDVAGGVRAVQFGTAERLRKVPLLRIASGVRYLDSHSTTPVRTAVNRFAMLHYKMIKEVAAAPVAARNTERSRGSQARQECFRREILGNMDRDIGGTVFEARQLFATHHLLKAGASTGREALNLASLPTPTNTEDDRFRRVDAAIRSALTDAIARDEAELAAQGVHIQRLYLEAASFVRPRDTAFAAAVRQHLPDQECVVFRAGVGALALTLALDGRPVIAVEASRARRRTIVEAAVHLGVAIRVVAPDTLHELAPEDGAVLIIAGVKRADDVPWDLLRAEYFRAILFHEELAWADQSAEQARNDRLHHLGLEPPIAIRKSLLLALRQDGTTFEATSGGLP